SITARVAASSGGQAAPKAQGCAATVVLVVTVSYGPHGTWSRDTVLIYDPPRGVHVLNGRTASTDRLHRDTASVRFPLPRPRHGHGPPPRPHGPATLHGAPPTAAHRKHARPPADGHAHSYRADTDAHTAGNSPAAADTNGHIAAAIHGHTNTGGDADQCHDPE